MGAQPAGDDRAEGKAKGKRESWRDWLPEDAPEPEELLTRDELVERLAQMGIDASAGDLQFWEGIGVLPRAVRQWHNGAVRAVYPDWFVHLVRAVRRLQDEGYTLRQIPDRVRIHARLMLAYAKIHAENPLPPPLTDPREIPLWPDLVTELERLARWHQAITGAPTTRVEVIVTDAADRATPYLLPLAPQAGTNSE